MGTTTRLRCLKEETMRSGSKRRRIERGGRDWNSFAVGRVRLIKVSYLNLLFSFFPIIANPPLQNQAYGNGLRSQPISSRIGIRAKLPERKIPILRNLRVTLLPPTHLQDLAHSPQELLLFHLLPRRLVLKLVHLVNDDCRLRQLRIRYSERQHPPRMESRQPSNVCRNI